ncbi:hypothetical protein KR084_002514, partial [Drosophila pseudotakahashii]
EDKKVLLEEARIIEMDHPFQESHERESEIEVESVNEEEQSPYRFLQNCNFVGLWMCVLYNFFMILLVVLVYVYKR